MEVGSKETHVEPYLEIRCTCNVLSDCSYNPIINPITTVILDIIGL